MDRTLLVRRGAPVAVFLAVFGGLVAIGARGSGKHLKPLPLNAGAAGAKSAADSARPAMYPYPYGGKLVFSDAVVAGLPDHGPVYKVASEVPRDRVVALARALGIDREPATDADGWVVGSDDWALRVTNAYGGTWYLGPGKDVAVSSGGAVATARPATVAPETAKPDASYAPTEPSPPPDGQTVTATAAPPPPCPSPDPSTKTDCYTPDEPPPSPPPAPSDDAARAAAKPVLDALGLSGARVTVQPGWGTKTVVADPVVGGLPTSGFATSVTVDVHGAITYANGYLGATSLENDYPLLDPRAAAERGSGTGIEPMLGAPATPCPTGEPCPTAPPDRIVSAVRLGLTFAPAYEPDAAFLAPAWLVTVEGETYETALLALPDEYLATPPPATDDGRVDDGGSGGSGVGSAEPGTPVDAPVTAQ